MSDSDDSQPQGMRFKKKTTQKLISGDDENENASTPASGLDSV
jgi:hypothetical protein